MNLLAQGKLTIADIALEVGFLCQSHVTTLFHKHAGTTPAAFRKAASRSARLPDPVALPPGDLGRPDPRRWDVWLIAHAQAEGSDDAVG
jgi:hypothetical protein